MWTKFKVYVCQAVKIYKNKPQFFFQTEVRAPGAPVLDPPLLKDYWIKKIMTSELKLKKC